MKTTTHKHSDSNFWSFNYRVIRGLVFVEINGEWRKSNITQNKLITLVEHQAVLAKIKAKQIKKKEDATALVAEHKKSKKILNFESFCAATQAGFSRFYIRACIQGDRKSHLGYVWRKAA
ncbi:MAG: hypothetical protein MJK10_03930 [Pseudomonadales bacterium]|nr:hypothetical protein [Pseudomonadales bacterium]NRA15221.1 hypothetical protein [Oceanospirillaceae bacterium]